MNAFARLAALFTLSLAVLGTTGCAAESDDGDGEAVDETSSALDGNRVQKSGYLVMGDYDKGGVGALCNYVIGITRTPTQAGKMTATGTVNCETHNLFFTVALYLERGDGYFDGINLCAACGTALQKRSGSGSKTMSYGSHRGTWTVSLFFADDGGSLNYTVKTTVKI